MSKVRVNAFSISIDGYGAGAGQSREDPLGRGGEALHDWFVRTRSFQQTYGREDGSTGIDDDLAATSMENLGAWIMGRNMFGPVRGAWPDLEWKGWWGDEPPYRCPIFVLTHHARPPLEMAGGTVFHFVTDGIHDALERARKAAGDRDIRIGGGVSVVRQYLETRLIDEMHLAIAPVLLGRDEVLFEGIDLLDLGYRITKHAAGGLATHVMIGRA